MNNLPRIPATLVQLRSFEAVARLGGVVRAAESLHIAQPTLSTQLRELSASLGMTLYEPRGRGLAITAEGELLLAATRDLWARWQRLGEDLAALRGLDAGRLQVAAVTTAEYFLPELIGRFAQAHPGVVIDFVVENRDAVVGRLKRAEVELAVMMMPPTDLPLARWPVRETPLAVVAPAGHPLTRRRRLSLAQVVREPLLAREAGSGTRRVADMFLGQRGVAWTPRMALGSNEAIKHAVAAGLGLAILSRHTLGADPAAAGLAELKVPGFPLRRMWHRGWREDRRLSRPEQALLNDLRGAAT